jgi:hypothetical protein
MPMPLVRATDIHDPLCSTVDLDSKIDRTFVNNLPPHRLFDPHTHVGSVQIQSCSTVWVEGKPCVRAHDVNGTQLGDMHAGCPPPYSHPPTPEKTGSPNVFIGTDKEGG